MILLHGWMPRGENDKKKLRERERRCFSYTGRTPRREKDKKKLREREREIKRSKRMGGNKNWRGKIKIKKGKLLISVPSIQINNNKIVMPIFFYLIHLLVFLYHISFVGTCVHFYLALTHHHRLQAIWRQVEASQCWHVHQKQRLDVMY